MKASAAILMLALVLGACAAKPPPIETITGKPIPPSEVKGTILRLTLGEWASFGKQRVFEEDGVEVIKPVGIWEDDRAGAALVAKYWQLLDLDSKLTGYDCAQPWSAVFISWVMRRSGVDPNQFEKSAAHRDYLRKIIAHEDDPAFKLKPRRAADYAPRPGDLICRARGKDYGLSDYHDLGDDALLHCDIVIFNEGGVLQSVGGNVRQSVSMTERPVDAQGRLADPWFVIENLYPEPGVPVAMN